MKTLELLDASMASIFTLSVRDIDPVDGAPMRNIEGVQPPGHPLQGAFGSGLHQAGELKRYAAMCSIAGYADVYAAKAALERALLRSAALQVDNWRLPIAGYAGIDEWALVLGGFKANLNLIPASPFWRYLVSPKTDTGSQVGTTITGTGFASGDVGRLVVWADGSEALITGYSSATTVTADVDQIVLSQAFTVYAAVTGLL